MTEITQFNFAENDFTAADLAKFEIIKSEHEKDLNKLAEFLNKIVASKTAKISQEKDEFYSKQLASKELESDIFYNHLPCGYFSTERNGIINKINDTLLVWLGYAKEDIIGKVTWQSLLSVGSKMYFETHYSPLLQMQGFVREISFEMVKKDNSRLPILINTKQIRDENGNVDINYSTVFDVSQRKSYENELLIAKRTTEERNEFIEYTFRNAATPIYYVLEDGSIYDFNDITAEILGYTSEEFRTLKIYDLDKNYDEKKWVSIWAKLKTEEKVTIETQHKKKDGTLRDVIITANYVKYGDIELKCSYVQDITEKKKQEEQLNLLDYSYKHTNSAMFFLDRDGLFIDFNEATANMLGYNYEEFRGKTVFDVNPMITKESWAERWEELKVTPNQNFDVKLKRKDGTFIDVEVSTNSIELNDKVVNFGFYEDITEKKKVAAELKLMDFAFEKSATPIILLSATREFYSFNNALLNLLGYTKEEFNKMNLLDIATTMDEASCNIQWDEILKNKNKIFECHFETKDGLLLDVELSANLINYNEIELNFCYVNDITEKKKAEAEIYSINELLQRQTNRLLLATKSAQLGIWDWDIKNDVLNWDEGMYRLYNIAENEFNSVFEGFISRVHQEDRQQLLHEMELGIANIKEYRPEFRVVWKDSSVHYINASSIIERDNDGNAIRMIGVNWDVTAEKEKIQHLKMLESVIIHTNDAVVVTEAEPFVEPGPRIVFVNDAYTRMTGYTKQEALGQTPRITQNDHTDRAELDRASEALKKWEPFEMTVINARKDGKEFWVNIRVTPIADEKGWFTHWVSIQRDVTKEVEEKQRLKLLESVIVHTKDSILITEAEPVGEPGPRILFVNPAFEKMTGYTPEEVIGLTPRLLQNEDTDRKELDKLRIALDKWEPCEITISNSKKNGEKFWNNFSVAPVANEKGWYTHWIAVERDVTKEKEAEQEKETLLKELVESNLELKQFSYITTHNLRAPLTNLVSICNIIKPETVTDALTRKLIEGFKTSTYHLNETLNDLIDVLIIKESRNIDKDQLTFEEILKKITESLSISLQERNVIINSDFSFAPSVSFVNEYLESVFLNLLTNAVKYCHPDRDPIITIKTSREPNGDTKLTFADNGIGINMAFAKDKIFGLYKRFHKNADSKGIGLYLVHSQITTLGGKIEVESEVNIGTTFTITFK